MEQALENENVGVALDDMTIADLDFADDICLLDDNGTDAQSNQLRCFSRPPFKCRQDQILRPRHQPEVPRL